MLWRIRWSYRRIGCGGRRLLSRCIFYNDKRCRGLSMYFSMSLDLV
jgi:hypothetical protein